MSSDRSEIDNECVFFACRTVPIDDEIRNGEIRHQNGLVDFDWLTKRLGYADHVLANTRFNA